MCDIREGMKDPATISDSKITLNSDDDGDTPSSVVRPTKEDTPGWKPPTKNKDGSSPSIDIDLTPDDPNEEPPVVEAIYVKVDTFIRMLANNVGIC